MYANEIYLGTKYNCITDTYIPAYEFPVDQYEETAQDTRRLVR